MAASTDAIPPSGSRHDPRVPRGPGTLLTKPECHCPACLLERIAAHGTTAFRATSGASDPGEPAPAGAIL
jgi:hypothetical protein